MLCWFLPCNNVNQPYVFKKQTFTKRPKVRMFYQGQNIGLEKNCIALTVNFEGFRMRPWGTTNAL